MITRFLQVVSFSFIVLFTWQCNSNSNNYAAVNSNTTYVGKELCIQCHPGQHQTFQFTGMGQSFGLADTLKSKGVFDSAIINDPFSGYSYRPYWNNGVLMVEEFLENAEGKFHSRTEKVDYIVGSGQHTNSHLQNTNGYIHQLPFTFYTQRQKLDFPPGFENGNNTRFSRKIGLECMSCHNAMPTEFVLGSENKFDKVPSGIDCERCHGPGSEHVFKIQNGDITDTAKNIDFSIVNPKKLSADKQFQICMRCHLQGNAVLKEGKSFFDFKPSMDLNEVMDVYMPRYTNSEGDFIMASHVDRFKMSKCFVQSEEKFVCTSCHNPHVSVKETNNERFNQECISCHSIQEVSCATLPERLNPVNNNCVECHMPISGSTDIPHVSVHDHNIKIHSTKEENEATKTFLKLVAVNNSNPTKRSRVNGYLQQFEKFDGSKEMLDSAYSILSSMDDDTLYFKEWIHYFFLNEMPFKITAYAEDFGNTDLLKKLTHKSYSNTDAWCAYRVGEAYKSFSDYYNAEIFYSRASELAPFNLEFRSKLAAVLTLQEKLKQARTEYEFILKEYPKSAEAWSNLGYIYLVEGDFKEAENYIKRSLALNPKYTQAKLNLASLYLATGDLSEAEKTLLELLENDPNNPRIISTLNYLGELKDE